MRSPPADIFVYGVHPATTKEDIVLDLAESGIVITEQCITKKSKDDAPLNSYRISVKAEDLDKALDPSVWPLRVKVREFIHYSKKNIRAGDNQGAQQQHGRVAGQAYEGEGQPPPGQVLSQYQQSQGTIPQIVAPNMYGILADGDSGATGHGVSQ